MSFNDEHIDKAIQGGSDAADKLTKILNVMSYEKEATQGFVDTIINSHRTIQQSTMRTVFALIMEWAKKGEEDVFDARNEATVKFSQAIKKLAIEQNISFPFI